MSKQDCPAKEELRRVKSDLSNANRKIARRDALIKRFAEKGLADFKAYMALSPEERSQMVREAQAKSRKASLLDTDNEE